MNNEKKVYSTGGNLGTFADAIERGLETIIDASNKATQKSLKDATGATAPETGTPATATPTSALPDLNTIEVTPVEVLKYDGEKKEKSRTEADGTRQWAEAAGEKMVQLEKNIEKLDVEIKKIERDPNSKFSSTAQNLLAQLKTAKESEKGKLNQLLSVGNEAAKAHMEFSALLAEIRGTNPNHTGEVHTIISRLINIGRRRNPSAKEVDVCKKEGKWPDETIFFEGSITFSVEGPEGKTLGSKALNAELRKLVDAAKFSKAASIKDRGNADLTYFPKGKPGKYYFFGPKRTKKNKSGEEYRVGEGHALIEVINNNEGKTFYDKDKRVKVPSKPFMVVYVRDAIGSMAKWLEKKERYIPFNWIETGRVMTSHENQLPKDEFDRALSIIHTLRELHAIWDKGLNPPTEPATPEEKTEDGPSYTTPPDNSNVIVEKVASTTTTPVVPTTDTTLLLPAPETPVPETPAPEKKPRKAKKTSAEKAE